MDKIMLALIVVSILLTGGTEGIPLRHRRQLDNEIQIDTTTTTTEPESATDAPTGVTAPKADSNPKTGLLKQRQPFSITGYSEDFKQGYVNPGPETLRQRLRGVKFDDNNAAVAPSNDANSPLIEKPFIWVIPYLKPNRQTKALDVPAPQIIEAEPSTAVPREEIESTATAETSSIAGNTTTHPADGGSNDATEAD